ncbi:MAG: MBL fold metallo-hydrolase [Candidatus Marinimicrobia bacterium]|nr:MBL fold metallo-hydrolase [Candidatus Neomarinimicrobiota bacterium]
MKDLILASGSDGNCIYIGEGDHGILIDAGISRRRIISSLAAFNIDPASIDGIFVTHEHADHVRGIEVISRHEKYPVYCTKGTISRLNRRLKDTNFVPIFQETKLNGFTIKPLPIPHDAEEPVSFVIETESGRLLVATDMGYVTDKVLDEISKCNGIIFESNHDIEMLINGPYPPDLKSRILSRWGHLSNSQCALALKKSWWDGIKFVTLAHLSDKNNLPELALKENTEALPKNVNILTANRHVPTGPLYL